MRKSQALKDAIAQVPEDRRIIAEKLGAELAFLEKTLKKLRLQIEAEGELETFQNGSQEFLREAPALKAYNQTVQRYSVMYRQLTDLMEKAPQRTDSPIFEFLKEGTA